MNLFEVCSNSGLLPKASGLATLKHIYFIRKLLLLMITKMSKSCLFMIRSFKMLIRFHFFSHYYSATQNFNLNSIIKVTSHLCFFFLLSLLLLTTIYPYWPIHCYLPLNIIELTVKQTYLSVTTKILKILMATIINLLEFWYSFWR